VIVLADLDGTLVDSGAAVDRAWARWGERHGIAFEKIIATSPGRPSLAVVADLAPHLDAAAEAAALDAAQAEDTAELVALPGAAELLDGAAGGPVAIVTSCTSVLARTRLEVAGLAIPDVLVTSDRVAAGKPHPAGYLLAARELGVEPADCTVLEDAPAGVQAGRAAGMHVVGVLTAHRPDELAAHEHHATVAEWLRAIGADGLAA
jgi:sugar-phosphatase